MPPRAAARQSASQPTQKTRTRASQSQRRHDEEEEEEEVEQQEQDEGPEEIELDGDDEPSGSQDTDRKANDLVRLALFTEYKRGVLKRDDINKKVLGKSRAFNKVFDQAQRILRKTFGMQMVELMSRAEREKQTEIAPTQAPPEEDGQPKKKKVTASSKTYIVRSILDPAIIERAARVDPQILACERKGLPDINRDEDEDEDEDVADGAIIAWKKADQLAAFGTLQVVLSLILVSGRAIHDQQLRAQLKALRLPAGSTIPLSAQSSQKMVTIDSHLASLVRMGYLDKQKTNLNGAVQPRGRVRQRNDDGDDGHVNYEWKWGSRSQAEVGEEAIMIFMVEFLMDRAGGDERGRHALREKLVKDITRSAGGNLTSVQAR